MELPKSNENIQDSPKVSVDGNEVKFEVGKAQLSRSGSKDDSSEEISTASENQEPKTYEKIKSDEKSSETSLEIEKSNANPSEIHKIDSEQKAQPDLNGKINSSNDQTNENGK